MKIHRRNPALAVVLAALLLATGLAPALRVTRAWAASPVVEQAQKLYDGAKFSDAIGQLRDALANGKVVGQDAVAARVLLARCLVKTGNRLEAKQQFETLLRQDPSWQPDAVQVPPDEMDVFQLASKEIRAEQIREGERIPASITANFGVLSSGRKDVKDLLSTYGGHSIQNGLQFGGAVRFPVSQRWSLDLGILHLGDKGTLIYTSPRDTFDVETHGLAIVGSAVYSLKSGAKGRINALAGVGPFTRGELRAALGGQIAKLISEQLVAQKTGLYAHFGVEGEYLLTKRMALSGLLDYRKAGSGKLDYGELGNTKNFDLNGREVDFSGVNVQLGLRAYIGY